MKRLDHPNITRLYEIIDDPVTEKLYLVTPVADYGECIEWDEKQQHFIPNHKFLARNNSKAAKISP